MTTAASTTAGAREVMSTTTIRPTSGFGRLLGARQVAEVVRQVAGSPADWLTRVSDDAL